MRQSGNKELNEPVVSNFDDTVQERIHCAAESLANHINPSIVVPVTLGAQDGRIITAGHRTCRARSGMNTKDACF